MTPRRTRNTHEINSPRPLRSISEVVREALRQLQRAEHQQAERLKLLGRAWRKGVDSGDAGELDFAELRRTAQREVGRRAFADARRQTVEAELH